MMNNPIHPKLDPTFLVTDSLVVVARELTRIAQAQVVRHTPRRGATLRPGRTTPMWNALVVQVLPHLKTRGEKVKLSRILGVPAPRLHEYLMAKTAMPDAERTLLLLHWLAQRRAGRPLA